MIFFLLHTPILYILMQQQIMWEVKLSETKIFINMKDILISHFSCYRVNVKSCLITG